MTDNFMTIIFSAVKSWVERKIREKSEETLREAKKDAVAVDGGAAITLEDIFGEPPYIIEMTPEEDEPRVALEVGYDNSASGLTATNVQAALDEVKSLTETAPANTDYSTYRLRNVAILNAMPETMNNGDIALVYS